ncbi:MAG TPA: hypothetical protein DEH02_00120, partial [Bacteroidales bacterium]|nr:hypothetical protein [Bacteroidales bacterium]
MKKITFSLALCFILLVVKANITGNISINQGTISFTVKNGYDVLGIPGYDYLTQPGAPMLPVKNFSFIIPSTQRVSQIYVNSITEIDLTGIFNIYPVQAPQYIMGPLNPFTEPDPAIYNANQFYPASNFSTGFTGNMNGAKIFSFGFYPFHYNPVTKQLKLITEINFTLVLETDPATFIKPAKMSEAQQASNIQTLSGMVANSGDIASFYSFPKSLPFDVYDHVILTTPAYQGIMQQLADTLTQYGLRTMVFAQNFATPEDARAFLQNIHTTTNPFKYLTIGGDFNIFPGKDFNIELCDANNNCRTGIMADYFYADINGTFNEGLGQYGDYALDLSVGRLPFHNATDAQNFVEKYFDYMGHPYGENTDCQGCETRALSFSSYDGVVLPSQLNETNLILSSHFNTLVLSAIAGNTIEDVKNALNNTNPNPNAPKYGVVCGYGHGDYNKFEACSSSPDFFYNYDFDPFSNNFSRKQIMLLQACVAGAYYDPNQPGGSYYTSSDYKSPAVEYFNNPNCGVAIIGNSNIAQAGQTELLTESFFGCLFDRTEPNHYRIGDAFNYTKSQFNQSGTLDGEAKNEFYRLNLSGLPSMPVWSKPPKTLNVAVTPTSNINNFVRVTVANPVYSEDITVCISKKNINGEFEIYAAQCSTVTAGINKNFDFQIEAFETPITNGDVYITVSGRNYIPFCTKRSIDINSQYAYIDNFIVHDDLPNDTYTGDGDGSIDAGEYIELSPKIINVNVPQNINTTVTLSTTNTNITIYNSTGNFLMPAQASELILDHVFSFLVSPDCPDNENVKFILSFSGGYSQEFYITVHAPVLTYYANYYSITPTNEIITSGDNLQLRFVVTNTGSEDAVGVSVKLAANGFIPAQTLNYFGTIPFGPEFIESPVYSLTASGFNANLPQTLTFISQHGRQEIQTLNFVKQTTPATVQGFDYIPGSNTITLKWDKVSGCRGYRIYQVDDAGVTLWSQNIYNENTTEYLISSLTPNTTYKYKMSYFASSGNYGNESLRSAVLIAGTNPPLHTGWPVTLCENYNIGNITAFDINNNGSKEIFSSYSKPPGGILGYNEDATKIFSNDFGFINTQRGTCMPAFADFNNDNFTDMATVNLISTGIYRVRIFKTTDDIVDGNADEWLSSPVGSVMTETDNIGTVVADIDGDGKKDIIVCPKNGNTVFVQRNNGDETFT